jgi:hypothetical protein
MKAFEVNITAIHRVERSWFDRDFIEDVDVVHLSVGDADEGGYGTTQIDQRVHLDRALLPAKLGPGKQRQAQIDRR